MPPINLLLVLVGLVLAGVLLAIGYWLGRQRVSKTRLSAEAEPMLEEEERQRMVGLLQGLSRWTNEYSGSVSNYQSELGELSETVRMNLAASRNKSGAGVSADQQQASDARMVTLLSQIMSTNEQLQSRLDAAEKQLEEQTEQIESYLTEARTDGLTGLFNRRAFDKKLDELFAIYRGGGSSFVLILIDIDNFKSINDNYGHPIGDVVLQKVAALLGGGIADAQIVARFGGEEFAILTHSPIRIAADQINRFRKKMAEQEIPVGNESITVTLSVGVSEPREDLVIGPIVRRADEALYNAKNMGRNRVYFNDGNGPQLVGAPEVARS